MIQFQMFDHQPERCEKYHQMLKDNLPVLEGIGSEADFEKTIADYLSFQFDMYFHGKPILKNTEILSDGLISIHGPMRQN